jgi:hypothetical protein
MIIRRHFLTLAAALPATVHGTDATAEAAQRGRTWLAGMEIPGLHLLPEYEGAKVIWLYHDNWLAARVLAESHPDLSRRILAAITARGVTRSGKIEMIFREATIPFHRYELRDVKQEAGYTLRSEFTLPELTSGWEEYADLLLIASIAETDATQARRHFDAALRLWDGPGFADAVVKKHRIYATYKLALALHAARTTGFPLPQADAIRARLLTLQHPRGGWITDYHPDGKPHGLANVETTSLAILALDGPPRAK